MVVTSTGVVLIGASRMNLGNVEDAGAAFIFSANVSTGAVVPVGDALLRPGTRLRR